MEFPLQAWRDADRRSNHFVPVVQPKQVGCWSKQSVNQPEGAGDIVYGSTECLAQFVQPQVPCSLNEGYPDAFVRKLSDGAPVEQVIGCILHAAEQNGSKPKQLLSDVKVVTFRNNLNKILVTPVLPKNGWTVDACLHQGTLFLEIVKTEEKTWDNQDLMQYYGYKFESLCSQAAQTDTGGPPVVDSTSEFAILVQLKLGDVGIIMAAEIDMTEEPVKADQHNSLPPLGSYLELKASKLPEKDSQYWTLANVKYVKWWLQSFLAGVTTILVGSWTDDGTLQEVQRLPVANLPKRAQSQGARWSAWQMLRFGRDVLNWMVHCGQQHPDQHIRFEYVPGGAGGGPGNPGTIKCLGPVADGQLHQRLSACLQPHFT